MVNEKTKYDNFFSSNGLNFAIPKVGSSSLYIIVPTVFLFNKVLEELINITCPSESVEIIWNAFFSIETNLSARIFVF